MAAPTRGSLTTATSIQIVWTALTTAAETGSSAITSYHLQWDQDGSGTTYYDLVGLSTTYTQTSYVISALPAGSSYNFKVRARNRWGFGPFSASTLIQSSTTALIITAPTVSVSGINVRITWLPPDNQGSTITQYKVVVKQTNLAYSENTQYCDGS